MNIVPVTRRSVGLRQENLHGLVGALASGEALVEATRKAYEAGYRRMDAYTPVPIEGLAEAMGRHGTVMPLIVLGGGVVFGDVRLSVQRRWTALQQLADVYPDHL